MNWNHRLVDMTAQNDGEHWLEIREVFYEFDNPIGHASVLIGGEDTGEVKETLIRLLIALEKPVLTLTKGGELK